MVNVKKVVKSIIKGKIKEKELFSLAKEQSLLILYEGKTILDYILEYKRNTEEFDKFAVYNVEIARKYLDYGLKPYIDSEEILLSMYDNEKTIFEKYIEKHFDVLFLDTIRNLIKEGKTLKEILVYKIEDRYIFEYLEDENLNLDVNYIVIANSKKLALDLIEKGYNNIIDYIYDADILKQKINGETVLYRLLSLNIFDADVLENLLDGLKDDCFSFEYNASEIIELLEKTPLINSFWFKIFKAKHYYDYEFNESYIEVDYLNLISATLHPLDLLIMSNLDDSDLENMAETDYDLALIYVKRKKWEVLTKIDANLLVKNIGNKTLLEYLYEEFIFDESVSSELKNEFLGNLRFKATDNNYYASFIANIAFKYNDFITALKNGEFLLKKENNETYLDIIIKKLMDSNNIRLLASIKYDKTLLTYKSKYLDNKMVIKYILDNFKEEFIVELIDENILLYVLEDGIPLLDFLIKNYRDLILEWTKKNPAFSDLRIVSILKANRIDVNSVDITLNKDDALKVVSTYVRKQFIERSDKEVIDEQENLIYYFYDLMIEDGKSDKEIVELACASFKEQFTNGFEYAYRDLQTLIEIKKRYPEFALIKGDISTVKNRELVISRHDIYNIDAFNHEMTHCLHLFLFSYKIPNSFNQFLNLDLEKVRKILNFVRMFKRKRDEFTRSLDDSLLKIGNQVDIESYHKLYYTQAKEALIKAKEEVFLDSEYIDYLTDNILTFEEFCSVFEKSVSLECKQEIASHEFGLECELEDLFDALSRGHFYSYGIDLNGETEILDIGHGANYYKSVEPFVEIIANYGVIIKSSRKEELLAILRDVMGQEFIEFLDKFYANMHLKDLDYKIEGGNYGL